VLKRFLAYGCAGWIAEVAFTGAFSGLFGRDKSATAKTYLWMHPIYGLGGLALEWMSARLRGWNRPARALACVPVIFGMELSSGWILRKALGRCPWDYKGQGVELFGLIRLDYAPAWYALALLFEPASQRLRTLAEGQPIKNKALPAVSPSFSNGRYSVA
jgi:uncharacterized membrane protein